MMMMVVVVVVVARCHHMMLSSCSWLTSQSWPLLPPSTTHLVPCSMTQAQWAQAL